jgi:hypothetical protein
MSALSSTSEEVFLLTCLRAYFQTTTASEVTSLLTVDLDWDMVIETAITKNVMPLLYQSLRQVCDSDDCTDGMKSVPQSVMLQLKIMSRMNGQNNLAKTKELVRILALLESVGIEAIAFKGAILAASVYGDIALRQFSDLDLLIRRQDFLQTKSLLIKQGYQSTYPKEIEIDLFHNHLQNSLSYGEPAASIVNGQVKSSLLEVNPNYSIDLHWGIPPRRVFKPEQCEKIRENIYPILLLDQKVKTFSPEATLVIQCLNAAKELANTVMSQPIEQICDIAKVIQVYPNLDWDLVLKIAAELRAQKLCLIGLFMAQSLLEITLPPSIQAELDRQLGNNNFTLSRNHPTLWQLLVNPLMTMDWAPYSIVAIGLHLKRSISPNQNDFQFLLLPRGLFFLYYLIRPIRLLFR